MHQVHDLTPGTVSCTECREKVPVLESDSVLYTLKPVAPRQKNPSTKNKITLAGVHWRKMDIGETMPAQKSYCNRSKHLAYIGHTTVLLLALVEPLTAAPRMQWDPDVKDGQ